MVGPSSARAASTSASGLRSVRARGGDGLEDAGEVADGHALGEQVAQDPLHLGEGEHVAADLAGDDGGDAA